MNKQKGTILVVDDTPANVRFLVGMLAENGYIVRPAIDSQLALAVQVSACLGALFA